MRVCSCAICCSAAASLETFGAEAGGAAKAAPASGSSRQKASVRCMGILRSHGNEVIAVRRALRRDEVRLQVQQAELLQQRDALLPEIGGGRGIARGGKLQVHEADAVLQGHRLRELPAIQRRAVAVELLHPRLPLLRTDRKS